MQSNVGQRLRLAEFRVLYKTWKRGIPWLDHLLLGLLVWLETKLIDARVKAEVDEAIREYETLHEIPMPDMVTPIYTEKPSASANSHSETSTSLPEMRLTAPWYVEVYDEK
jgi:hypothetical protein